MDILHKTIENCPIIDNHAHNLLLPDKVGTAPLLSITSEAQDDALAAAQSTLAHLRAVQQLADVLNCSPNWDDVKKHIDRARSRTDDAWAKRCFQGIATALIDDGLDKKTVHPVEWHDRLTPHPCKRIVRIEVVAQDVFADYCEHYGARPTLSSWVKMFKEVIRLALEDPLVVGFKSIVCYRAGLGVPVLQGPGIVPVLEELSRYLINVPSERLLRLEDERLNALFVNLAAAEIQAHQGPTKPFQFHTGLGDNDITLRKSSASLLQELIKSYPKVTFVLLHASYPFTREAAYLASVYSNCYLDIGEVFPMISQDGQEHVIRQSLELCPSEKLCWSTDGHWFPETYLLAVIQIREGLKKVLGDYVSRRSLTPEQAIDCARNVLYNTSNEIYHLGLPDISDHALTIAPNMAVTSATNDIEVFEDFLRLHPNVEYVSFQYVDYASIRRARVVPIKRVREMLQNHKYVGIQKGVYRMLPNDSMAPNTVHQGEWAIKPCLESLRGTGQEEVAAVMCEIQNKDGTDLAHDPRTVLRRTLEEACTKAGLELTFGFEIEVVFMASTSTHDGVDYSPAQLDGGHCWSGAVPLETKRAVALIRDVLASFRACGVEIEQYHSEGAKSQYEFILAPRPAMAAVEQLIAARAAIVTAADGHGLRATLVPKIIGQGFGTGAHIHLSLKPEHMYKHFYAGVLKHMRGILALAMSGAPSYERMGDGLWSGGTWVCWGDQNREACLRRVEGSHWECKVVDGLAHPYLVVAALVGAGTHGVVERMQLVGGSVDTNPGDLNEDERSKLGITERLPSNFEEALAALEGDEYLCKVLGRATVQNFADVKGTEAQILADMDEPSRQSWLVARY